MTFKPAVWHPIALVLTAVNLAAIGAAAGAAEPWHAGAHGLLAVGFGLWSQRLRQRKIAGDISGGALAQERFDVLEAEVGELRRELNDAQERLDFTERMLAQGAEARRVGPER
jgi:hypothetical protein